MLSKLEPLAISCSCSKLIEIFLDFPSTTPILHLALETFLFSFFLNALLQAAADPAEIGILANPNL